MNDKTIDNMSYIQKYILNMINKYDIQNMYKYIYIYNVTLKNAGIQTKHSPIYLNYGIISVFEICSFS